MPILHIYFTTMKKTSMLVEQNTGPRNRIILRYNWCFYTSVKAVRRKIIFSKKSARTIWLSYSDKWTSNYIQTSTVDPKFKMHHWHKSKSKIYKASGMKHIDTFCDFVLDGDFLNMTSTVQSTKEKNDKLCSLKWSYLYFQRHC